MSKLQNTFLAEYCIFLLGILFNPMSLAPKKASAIHFYKIMIDKQ